MPLRIDGNGYDNSYNVTAAGSRNGATGDQAFSLEQGGNGVLYEPEEDRRREASKTAAGGNGKTGTDSLAQGGVRLELSKEGTAKAEAGDVTQPSLLEQLQKVIQAAGRFFSRLGEAITAFWNGSDLENSADAENSQEFSLDESQNVGQAGLFRDNLQEMHAGDYENGAIAAAANDLYKADVQKQDVVATMNLKNDPEMIQQFMQNYHGKHLVKNSDLLTYYDKSGKKVFLDASDKRKILQGRYGEREL